MSLRNYSNTGQTSTLTAGIGATDTTISLAGYAGDPSPPFTAALARGTATEEVVLVTGVSGSTVTVTRGYDGTAPQAQGAGATFQEVVVALDYREANNHVNATTGVHGVTGALVGLTDVQTLTNKTLTSPTLSGPTLTGTATAATLNVTTLTVSGVSTLANVTVGGTLGVTGLLTASGGITIPTGKDVTLTDAPGVATDAANKGYVDGKTWTSATISDATSSPTANTVVKRDAAGRAQVVTPSATGDIATKGYADGLGVSAGTVSTIVRRDAAGRAQFVNPSAAQDAATKDYVDSFPATRAYARMRQTVAQTLLASGWNDITLDVEDVDSANGHSTSSLTARWVCPVGQDGWYEVSGVVAFGSVGGGGLTFGARIAKNGTEVPGAGQSVPNSTTNGPGIATGAHLVQLAAGDYVTLQGFVNTGNWATFASTTPGSTSSQSSLSVIRVR